jgi:hypothetical protein
MQRLIFATLLCCSLPGVSYGQGRSANNGPTRTESCTTRDSGWRVDVKVAEGHNQTRETHCEKTEPAPKEPKTPREPRETREAREARTPRDKNN